MMKDEIREEHLFDLAKIVRNAVGLSEDQAKKQAERIYFEMRKTWGGKRVHFHKVTKAEAFSERVKAKFNGKNRQEVCAEFGISEFTLYKILKR